jgi:hypothetical protein
MNTTRSPVIPNDDRDDSRRTNMTSLSPRSASTLWIVLLTAASTLTTWALACATPFPALAALAAVHMRRRDGITLMLIAWAASQIVGFGLLGYPHDPVTIGWGIALGVAATGSAWTAYAALDQVRRIPVAGRLALAYGVGFAAFKAIVLLFAFGLGGVAIASAPGLLANQFVRNGAILIGLWALYGGLTAIGVPAASRRQRAAAA